MAYSAWSVVYGEQPSAAKWNILGTNDSEFNSLISHNAGGQMVLNDTRVQTDNSNSIANSTVDNLLVQFGWGQVVGSGASTVTDTVTYPTAFDTVYGVTISFAGSDTSAPPAPTITGLDTASGGNTSPHAYTTSIGTTTFGVVLDRIAGTFNASFYWGYTWIAWGAKA